MDNKLQTEELDVRVLIPIERHKKLIQLFKELPVDESFIFINDHDPIPLFYEFRSIYGDVVGWEYLNRGGREWKVKVTRTESSQGREFTDISTLLDLRKANEKAIKFLGILALLLVFELVNLFLHPYIGSFTHETPIFQLLIAVVIAAILIPLHHRLQHLLTHQMVIKNKQLRLAAAERTVAKLKKDKDLIENRT
jgi:uncharacterized protein (DUF2249 family)